MAGVCVPPFGIFIKRQHEGDARLLAHEMGHWEQYLEIGFWRFHWWWIRDYTINKWGRQDSDSIERDADKRAGL
jgi:hypothetical protein